MDYKDEKESDNNGKKKKFNRKDFKDDVKEAVEEAQKGGKKGGKQTPKTVKKGAYSNMSVSELRQFLNSKKKALLTKSGFPDGKLPRSKVDMISLCKKLKRKRSV